MTVYVDDMLRKARVRRFVSRWSHLVSDQLDPEELHMFAESIDLHRHWFQHDPKFPHRDHYDVTERKRAAALRAGAVSISYPGGLAEILEKKKP